MKKTVLVLSAVLLGLLGLLGQVQAQEPLWQIHGPANHLHRYLCTFRDYDGDGHRDLMLLVYPSIPTSNIMEARIVSGLDGSVLWSRQIVSGGTASIGDMDGDGSPDFASWWPNFIAGCPGCTPPVLPQHKIQVWSPQQNRLLWEVFGNLQGGFGYAMLGDLDTDGDGRPNFITLTRRPAESDVYVYDHRGRVQYVLPMLSQGLISVSLAAMGDMDGDGCDDFVVGCDDLPLERGAVLLVSGRTGTVLRTSYGLQAYDKTFDDVTNLGDIDGDGVNDYAAFPWWSAQRLMAVCWSGATGNVIRTLTEYTESVIASEDLDLDGINDLVLGWEYPVQPPNVYGRSIAISGRDGSELWRLENYFGSPQPPSGWGRYGVGLGVQPGSPYPAIAWLDLGYYLPQISLANGRIRAFRAMREGQGPVFGASCSSTDEQPMIGARHTATGSRVTIAKGPPGAMAWLNLAIGNPGTYQGQPLPIALDGFGLTGCQLHVALDVSFLRVLGTNGIDRGYAAVDWNHGLAATQGTIVQAQWLLFDPATSDYAATQKHQLRLQ